MRPDVLVVGGGVSGLTCAVRLLEAGRRVTIWTAEPTEATTSAVAAALWYPYRAAPRERVTAWAGRSLEVLGALAEDAATGVRLVTGLDLSRTPLADPWWAAVVPTLRACPRAELPAGYAGAHLLEVPVAETPIYLPWLTGRVTDLGGEVVQRRIESLDQAAAAAPVVVHCAGLGARALADDPAVRPVRGQVVRVTNPGVERFLLDEDHPAGPTYVIPRSTDCVLGGTAEEDRWDTAPDPAVASAILARCTELEPRLEGVRVLGHAAGLRPVRDGVRVAVEQRHGVTIVHNYGHGGAGITLSWGCAEEVVALVDAGAA
jgi:D-amino-acid oxidase